MAVSTTTTYSGPYFPNGATVAFPFDFKAVTADEVAVVLRSGGGETIADPATYSVTLAEDGGTVTFASAPASGSELYVTSDPLFTQEAIFSNQAYNPVALNALFDRDAVRAQHLKGLTDRAVRTPLGETGFNIPAVVARASKWAVWDSAGALVGEALSPGLAAAGTVVVSSRVALANLETPSAGQHVRLAEPYRRGWFEWSDADLSAEVASDPLQGLYVAPASDASGTSGAWVREWDGVQGHPEWFRTGSDWLPALQACLALCPATVIGPKDYTVSDTWHIQTENRAVWGSSRFNRTTGTGPRIVLNHPTKDAVMVGYATQPSGGPEQDGAGAGFLKNVTLDNFAIWRGVAPTPFAVANDFNSAGCGLRVQYVLKCQFKNLLVQDSTIGVYAGATIYTKFIDVEARNDNPNTLGNFDTNRTWVLDGARTFGYAGGNASIYLERCVGVAGRKTGGTTDSDIPISLFLYGAYVDTFVTDFEAAGTSKPMVFFSPPPHNEFARTVDVHIMHPIIDQCDTYGIEVGGYGGTAGITIIDPYITSNGSATDALLIYGGAGVTVLGGQILGAFSTAGLHIAGSGSYKIDGLRVMEQAHPVLIENCGSGEVKCFVTNRTVSATQAYQIINTSRARLIPITANTPGKISYGISIDAASTRCVMDVTGVEDGPSDRIQINGGGVANQGNIGTHFIINAGQPFTV